MSRIFKINVNGTDYDVTVQEMTDVSTQLMPQYRASAPIDVPVATPVSSSVSVPAPAPVPKRAAPGSNEQCAQMGGVVAGIFVTVGQTVTTGDRLVGLEAMKMKVPVMATASGQVSGIKVAVGEAVERGQVLITLA